jgi:hypothetical protein
MSKDSLLKKEFKQSDVQRARNLVNKDYTAGTKIQSGYQKSSKKHYEGDVWEDNGKTWTIKNGIRQNITKLDSAKKAIRMPLVCPKCGGPMKHHLAKKMYKLNGFCFDPCTIDFENNLRKIGLYEDYVKKVMSGNINTFADDIESWVVESISEANNVVTEDGTIEDWGGMNKDYKEKILKDLKTYVTNLRSRI